MAVTPTEDPKYLQAALPDRIVEDEVIFMDGGDAPLWPHWQRLYDRTAHHELAVFGSLSWNGDFAVDAGGSSSSFTVRIGAINAVHLYNATASKVLAYGGGTIGASKIEGGGNLGNSEWRYVYAWINAGALDFEISTTAPNASRTLKSGDTTRRYLGCFRTTSAGAPIPVRASRGRYVYRRSGGAVADTRLLSAGNATTATAVDCSALVPPHARLVTLHAELLNTAAAINYAHLRTNGDSGADELTIALTNVNNSTATGSYDIETDSSRNVAYYVTNFGSAPSLSLWAGGFYE